MRLVSRHRLWRVAVDAGLITLAWYLAFQVRFDKGVPARYDEFLGLDVFIAVVSINLVVFVVFGLYHHWWRYVSIRDMWRAVLAVTVASVAFVGFIYLWDPVPGWSLPRGIIAIDWMFTLGFVVGARVLARTLVERARRGIAARRKAALIVGAGDAGQMVIREMLKSPQLGYSADRPRRRPGRQEEHASPRGQGARVDDGPPAPPGGQPPRRGDHRHPVRRGRGPATDRQRLPRRGRAREDGARRPRAHRRRPQPLRPAPRGAGGGRPRPRGRRARHPIDCLLRQRRDRARHRGRRVDRVRALPAGRRARRRPDHPRRPLRERPRGSRARAPARAQLHGHRARHSPTSRIPARFAASSSATSPRSSSTRPPTSTSR